MTTKTRNPSHGATCSERHQVGASGARTHVCVCVPPLRKKKNNAFPFHLLIHYFALLERSYGQHIDDIPRGLPLNRIVEAFRRAINASNVDTVTADGGGRQRERYAGQASGVVSVVWALSTFQELLEQCISSKTPERHGDHRGHTTLIPRDARVPGLNRADAKGNFTRYNQRSPTKILHRSRLATTSFRNPWTMFQDSAQMFPELSG